MREEGKTHRTPITLQNAKKMTPKSSEHKKYQVRLLIQFRLVARDTRYQGLSKALISEFCLKSEKTVLASFKST